MALLTPGGKNRISKAISEAEKNTGGEIVVAIIPESDDYMARELTFGIACSLITSILLIMNLERFDQLVESIFWIDFPALMPLSMMALILFAGALAYALAQVAAVDRILVGKRNMAEAVRRRAMRHFVESAVYDTVDRTGVLLFISVLERRVELIADKGINSKVESKAWESIVSLLVGGIRKSNTSASIEAAVRSIGEILAEHVPPRPEDINEISDSPTELGKGS